MDETTPATDLGPYADRLGVEVQSLTESAAKFLLPFKEENSNPGGALHGGVAASMINLGGLAVSRQALGVEGGPFHSCAVQVTYLAAAINEPIIAEATLLRRGKEICFVDTAVSTEDGKPIARGLSTVRGRFGREEGTPIPAGGDDGHADPGMMGPFLTERVPFIGRLGLKVENMVDGRSRISMAFQEANGDGASGTHEGPILALLDTTGAMAAWAETGPGGFKASTVGIQAQVVAPAGEEDLVAYGHVRQRDKEIFWSDVEVALQSNKKTVARGTVLYRIVVPEGA